MRARFMIGFVLLPLGLTGCPSHTFLSVADQEKIQITHQKKVYFLRQAFFSGPFYTYEDRQYISERAFDERVLIQSPGGDPILTSAPTGILPLGTQVTIREIEFPTGSAVATRNLRSPRFFTWVTLDRADLPQAKPFVLVLTPEFKSIQEFEQSLGAYLDEQDPRPEYAKNPEDMKAINGKTLYKGMRADALLRARGYPDRITRKFESGVKLERWQYAPERIVVLKADVVEEWGGFPSIVLDSGEDEPAPQPAPQPPAPDSTVPKSAP